MSGMDVLAVNISATNSGTGEAAIATTPTMSSVYPGGAGYLIHGVVQFTGNASASTTTLKIRQNSSTGTTVFTSSAITVAAGAVVCIPFLYVDYTATAGGVANYVLTQTNSAAAGASGAITGAIKVEQVGDVD